MPSQEAVIWGEGERKRFRPDGRIMRSSRKGGLLRPTHNAFAVRIGSAAAAVFVVAKLRKICGAKEKTRKTTLAREEEENSSKIRV